MGGLLRVVIPPRSSVKLVFVAGLGGFVSAG